MLLSNDFVLYLMDTVLLGILVPHDAKTEILQPILHDPVTLSLSWKTDDEKKLSKYSTWPKSYGHFHIFGLIIMTIFNFCLGLAWQQNLEFGIHWQDLVNINQYAKNYQNTQNSLSVMSKIIKIFITSSSIAIYILPFFFEGGSSRQN